MAAGKIQDCGQSGMSVCPLQCSCVCEVYKFLLMRYSSSMTSSHEIAHDLFRIVKA